MRIQICPRISANLREWKKEIIRVYSRLFAGRIILIPPISPTHLIQSQAELSSRYKTVQKR